MQIPKEIKARMVAKISTYKQSNRQVNFVNDETLVFELLRKIKTKMNNDEQFDVNILKIENDIRLQLRSYYGL